MENRKTILQTLKKKLPDVYSIAEKYYTFISVMNDIKLSEREIQLISFFAVKGNISYTVNKEEFCEKYNSSEATMNNIISKLKKMKILYKEGNRIKLHSAILLDFSKNISLNINLVHE